MSTAIDPAPAQEPRRDRLRDGLAVVALLGLGVLLFLARAHARPDTLWDSKWVVWENGNQLYRADLIARGQVIYRDFSCQYGPIPVYAYAAVARVLGNTIGVCLAYHLALRLAALGLIYGAWRRSMGSGLAFVFGVVVGLPSLLPGAGLGNLVNYEALPFEIVLLAAPMALYEPPDRRGRSRSAAIGLVLGLGQWVKFGGPIVAGLALLTVDLLWVARMRPGPAVRRSWQSGLLAMLGVALALEGSLAAFVGVICPGEIARDVLWPSYILKAYAGFHDPWPALARSAYFITGQLLPLSAFGFGTFLLLADFRAGFDARRAASLNVQVGLVFYWIGIAAYFKHSFLFYHYAWTVLPAGCLAVARLPRFAQILVIGTWSPALIVLLKLTFWNPMPTEYRPYPLGPAGTLYPGPSDTALLDAVRSLAVQSDRDGPGRDVALYVGEWSGGGIYHAFGGPVGFRNVFLAPGGYRPYDERDLLAGLDRVAAFFWLGDESPRARLGAILSPAAVDRILDAFAPQVGASGSPIPITVLQRKP